MHFSFSKAGVPQVIPEGSPGSCPREQGGQDRSHQEVPGSGQDVLNPI